MFVFYQATLSSKKEVTPWQSDTEVPVPEMTEGVGPFANLQALDIKTKPSVIDGDPSPIYVSLPRKGHMVLRIPELCPHLWL